MGFFGDLKADITQAVDELTDGGEGENMKKENTKKGFGRKNKKNVAVKVTDINTSEENLFQAVEGGEEDRSETEKALWDEIRADLSDESEEKTEDAGITEEDEVEEIEEIQEPGDDAEQNDDVEADMRGGAMANTFHNTNMVPETNFSIPEGELSDEVGIITGSMTVLGNIYSTGHMEIYGNVEGDVEVNGSLRVLGSVTGNVKASEIIVESGKIKGNVVCATAITVSEGSVIIGQLIAAGTGAAIAGAIKGDIDVHGPVTLDSTAIVKGNIKSQSVQMANGAMVDGMCSQCYSDVDLSSYFDNMI
ncbi:MAG: polymer-forming cytoskeletal protein [Lachnospiraceae bacterium]|nr:polymer-forming cytoskeletal protein [Lachnospiraceae bacterium]